MPRKVVALGALAILAFDVLASLASRAIGFPYSYAVFGSWLIYAACGYLVGRQTDVGTAALGVAMIAGVEATIGWALSWAIGPGRLPNGFPGYDKIVITVLLVIATGAVIGAITGWLARSRH